MSTKPWERRDDETEKAWAAFCAYRDLPPQQRSLEAAWRSLNAEKTSENVRKRPTIAPANWTSWAFNHDWKARVLAYDRDQDRKHLENRDRIEREEAERFRANLRRDNLNFARGSRAMMKLALRALDAVDIEAMNAKDAAGLWAEARRSIEAVNEREMLALGLDELMGLLRHEDHRDAEDEGTTD